MDAATGESREMQERLNDLAQHCIAPSLEIILIQQLSETYKSVKKSGVQLQQAFGMAGLA